MQNSLINLAFKKAKNENRSALLTYTVAGDNTKKKSLEILIIKFCCFITFIFISSWVPYSEWVKIACGSCF